MGTRAHETLDGAISCKNIKDIGTARDALQNLGKQVRERSPVSSIQPFLVIDRGSVTAAQKAAARIKDAEQREVLAWGRFTFEGSPQARTTLAKLLP